MSVSCSGGLFCRGNCEVEEDEPVPKDKVIHIFHEDEPFHIDETYYELVWFSDTDVSIDSEIIPKEHAIYKMRSNKQSTIDNKIGIWACGGNSFVAYRISPRSDTRVIIATNGFPNWEDSTYDAVISSSDEDSEPDDSTEE